MQQQQMHCSIIYGNICYGASTCFVINIAPSSGRLHQNFSKTCNNAIDHNKHTYVVVSIVQNFTGFGYVMYVYVIHCL